MREWCDVAHVYRKCGPLIEDEPEPDCPGHDPVMTDTNRKEPQPATAILLYTPAMSNQPKRHVTVSLRMTRFELPPVESALVVGRRSPIGSNALEKALGELLPGVFRRIEVQHPVIEALIVRDSHTRRISEDKLVRLLIRHAEDMMDETETLRVTADLVISSSEDIEL